jgi:hypothetical protein
MSIGPLQAAANVTGSPLTQLKGTDVERAQEDAGAQRRQLYHQRKAEAAAGVGEPDGEDHETHDRHADGRRPWEDQPEPKGDRPLPDVRESKDPSRQSGNLLDLTG